MPESALFDQCADELREEEWIAFGMPIDEGEELTPDFLAMKRRRQPLLDFVAGQSSKCQLGIELVTLEDQAAFSSFGELPLVAAGEADKNALGIELSHDVLERIPRRAIRPLHLVEHEHQRARDRCHSQVREQL